MSDLSGDAAQATGKRIGRMRLWERYGVVVIIAAIIAVLAVMNGVGKLFEAGQFSLRMRPSAPLTTAACSAEVARYGWNVHDGAPVICRIGNGRTWYRAILTNGGGGAYPACRATGLDGRGKVVFSGPLVFIFGGFPAGLYAKGHGSTAFTWYLPDISAPIARYITSCGVNENPPV